MNKKNIILLFLLVIALAGLMILDVCSGSVWIDIRHANELQNYILQNIRIPKMLTAITAGMALSVSGAIMQTLFRNPLAGPYILGVSSGASLGVAIITMAAGAMGVSIFGGSIITAAIVGAVGVLMLVLLIARRIRSNVTLLIVGMMIGSIAGAVVNLIQNYANPDALKLFIVWSLGSLSAVGWNDLPILAAATGVGLLLATYLIKPLNGLLLGENYAYGLGINIRRIRLLLVLTTSILAGSITAYCGPIAFIGVAVPHMARGLFRTANHQLILPATALIGADILLICDILSSLSTYPLPISTVSALFGAPIIIYIITRKQ